VEAFLEPLGQVMEALWACQLLVEIRALRLSQQKPPAFNQLPPSSSTWVCVIPLSLTHSLCCLPAQVFICPPGPSPGSRATVAGSVGPGLVPQSELQVLDAQRILPVPWWMSHLGCEPIRWWLAAVDPARLAALPARLKVSFLHACEFNSLGSLHFIIELTVALSVCLSASDVMVTHPWVPSAFVRMPGWWCLPSTLLHD
jgi:hypothetical protein